MPLQVPAMVLDPNDMDSSAMDNIPLKDLFPSVKVRKRQAAERKARNAESKLTDNSKLSDVKTKIENQKNIEEDNRRTLVADTTGPPSTSNRKVKTEQLDDDPYISSLPKESPLKKIKLDDDETSLFGKNKNAKKGGPSKEISYSRTRKAEVLSGIGDDIVADLPAKSTQEGKVGVVKIEPVELKDMADGPSSAALGEDSTLPAIVSLGEYLGSRHNNPLSGKQSKKVVSTSQMISSTKRPTTHGSTMRHRNRDALVSVGSGKSCDGVSAERKLKEKQPVKLWDGSFHLSGSRISPVLAFYKSGEKTHLHSWPETVEVKGRVRLDNLTKFLQELHLSRTRAVTVVSCCMKAEQDGNTTPITTLKDVANQYQKGERVGFAAPLFGVELYLFPLGGAALELLATCGYAEAAEPPKIMAEGYEEMLVGCIVWKRRKPLPNVNLKISSHYFTANKHALSAQLYSPTHPDGNAPPSPSPPSPPPPPTPLDPAPSVPSKDSVELSVELPTIPSPLVKDNTSNDNNDNDLPEFDLVADRLEQSRLSLFLPPSSLLLPQFITPTHPPPPLHSYAPPTSSSAHAMMMPPSLCQGLLVNNTSCLSSSQQLCFPTERVSFPFQFDLHQEPGGPGLSGNAHVGHFEMRLHPVPIPDSNLNANANTNSSLVGMKSSTSSSIWDEDMPEWCPPQMSYAQQHENLLPPQPPHTNKEMQPTMMMMMMMNQPFLQQPLPVRARLVSESERGILQTPPLLPVRPPPSAVASNMKQMERRGILPLNWNAPPRMGNK